MTNPPIFTVAPTSQRGQSLFQWYDTPTARFPMSLQMPTDIAEHLAGLAKAEREARDCLATLMQTISDEGLVERLTTPEFRERCANVAGVIVASTRRK